MFWIIKNILVVLLTSIVNASNYAKWISLTNRKCETQPTLVNLYPNKYSIELHYYPFAVNLDKCVENSDTLNDLLNKVGVWNKTEDLNIHFLNIIRGKN